MLYSFCFLCFSRFFFFFLLRSYEPTTVSSLVVLELFFTFNGTHFTFIVIKGYPYPYTNLQLV